MSLQRASALPGASVPGSMPLARVRRPAQEPEPWLTTGLRACVYLAVAGIFAQPLSTPTVVWSVAVAAGVFAVVGRSLAASRLRSPWIVVGSALLMLVGFGLRGTLLAWPELALRLGPAAALRVADACGYAVVTAGLVAGLRGVALRFRALSLLEVACVVVAFAQLVVAHRNGAINRPFELADSILAEGGDPTLALLAVGVAAAVAIVVLLLRERELWRALLHLTLALALLGVTRMFGPPPAPPQEASGLGLTGKGEPDDDERSGQRPRSQEDDQLEFRDNRDHNSRQTPLAVVLLHDDYSPPTGTYYFRQSAFSQYNGRRLVSATRADVDTDLAPQFVVKPLEVGAPRDDGEVRRELDTSVALLADHTRPFALESLRRIMPAQNPDPARFRRVYRATSSVFDATFDELLGRQLGDPLWSPEQLAHYTEAPRDPRYAELAAEIRDELPEALRDDRVAQALFITLWLGKEGTYSLRRGHGEAEDPTADFLFGDRTGYCVHFAHAAVYLMRELGIPSRVGAGYAVEEASRQGGSSILLTGAHSHAWPEVYVDGAGWVVADVAPARSLDPPPPPPDPDLQRLLGEMARGLAPLPQAPERLLQPALRTMRWLDRWLAPGVALAALVVFGVLYLIKLWRRGAPWLARERDLPRVEYRAWLDRLSDVALRRRPGETREAFAARLDSACPSFAALTRAHLDPVFGQASQVSPADLRRLSRQIRAELSRSVPGHRRWLGLFVPWSWLRSQ